MENKYDCLIVGSGTSGTYLAYRLSKLGFSVLVLDKEKEENVCNRFDLIHFPLNDFSKHQLETPNINDEDCVEIFHDGYTRSALDKNEKKNRKDIFAAHFHKLFLRFKKQAINEGAEFTYETEVKTILYDNKRKPNGLLLIKDNKAIRLYANLIVDATGIRSALRKHMHSDYVDPFYVSSMDRFYVVLTYVEWLDKKRTNEITSWPYYKSWVAPSDNEFGGLIGTGAVGSVEHALEKQEEFLNNVKIKDYKVIKTETGSTPYSRSPFSFVSDNFFICGDSACLTNPMSGEGMAMTFDYIDMALPTLEKCLRNKDCSVNNLWPINVEYNSKVGCFNNLIRTLVIALFYMSKEENDYLFEKNIIFKSDGDKEPNMLFALISGRLKRRISHKSFKKLIQQYTKGNKLCNHYKAYPKHPKDYKRWMNKANKLWNNAGKVAEYDK